MLKDYFRDAIPISSITNVEEIDIAIFCHGSFCRIPLTKLASFLRDGASNVKRG